MSTEIVTLPGDMCMANRVRELARIVSEFGDGDTYRLVVVTDSDAVELGHMASRVSIFPVAWDGQYAHRGDTRKRGQSGVHVDPSAPDTHALSVVWQRAGRMAR